MGCGGGDLNEKAKKLVSAHMRNAKYLEDDEAGITIENIIESEIMPQFETESKRTFNLRNENQRFSFRIRGLRDSSEDPMLKRGAFVLSLLDFHNHLIVRLTLMYSATICAEYSRKH